METLFCQHIREIVENKKEIERRVGVQLTLKGKVVTIEGDAVNEYEARTVLEAISFGFSTDVALTLRDEEVAFKRLNIKDFTRRKDLSVVKARLIGTQGKTRRNLENVANCTIVIQGNEVGIIGEADEMEYVVTAVSNLIRGSKQSNVYKFLERINTQRKDQGKSNF